MVKNAALERPRSAPAAPAHEQVYRDLRERVLFGDLAPGQSVTIHGLAETLGAGLTPVREAIRRLIAEGALVFLGNRRVIVPVLTVADLEQLVFVRKTIETELARRAVAWMSPEMIKGLERIDTALDKAISNGDVAGYLTQNYGFHTAIYEQARAPIMAELADRLWLRFGPSLRVVCGRFGTQNLPDRHKDMLDAMRAGDADRVVQALVQDIDQGMEQIAGVLRAEG